MAAFDKHSYSVCTDPCAMKTEDCPHCNVLREELKALSS